MKKSMLLVLGVGVVALALFALRPAPAEEGPTFTSPVPVPSDETLTPSALWVGDSYTEGYGATSRRGRGYACPVSVAMGWTCNLDAQGGTGYINNGRTNVATNLPVKDRLPQIRKKYLADVIVVDAGRNDDKRAVSEVAAAARKYLTSVRKLWPRAEIVVISPYFLWSRGEHGSYWQLLAAELQPIVADIDGHLIDPIGEGWIPPPDPAALLTRDGTHPNNAGYRYLRNHLLKEFRSLGLDDVRVTDKRGPQFQ